eukprot:11185510-Lingulodinium_polyedra.AAC.2
MEAFLGELKAKMTAVFAAKASPAPKKKARTSEHHDMGLLPKSGITKEQATRYLPQNASILKDLFNG